MKLPLILIAACVICGCDSQPQERVPVRVKIVSVNDPGTFQDRFASAVVELPNGRRFNIYGRFGRVGDSFIMDVPESSAQRGNVAAVPQSSAEGVGPMTAKQMRALGWRNATTSDAAKLVLGRRYLVANRKGTKVESAVCNETLELVPFWDKADTDSDEVLGEVTSWPWFKEDKE